MTNEPIIPPKLKSGDTIRVIAPARSLGIISPENRKIAQQRFADIGLHLTFGRHVEEMDQFRSSSIESRIEDLHDAFRDPTVQGIAAVIGGFNSNQLLRSIDWELIRRNPKVFWGYSDITVLHNAMLAKAGLVTYSGPAYSTFGMLRYFEYDLQYFQKCVMEEGEYTVMPSTEWSDDPWYLDQGDRHLIKNPGYLVLHEGKATGRVIGGNLGTFQLLLGTEYCPDLDGSILFVEDDMSTDDVNFDRDLLSILHQPGFAGVKGLVIGRFQLKSEMTDEKIMAIIASKKELEHIPVLANADFGHTDSMFTYPIGGTAKINVQTSGSSIAILRH